MASAQTIALTGATGFVGRAVLSQCLGAGHDVRALVRNLANPQAKNLTFVKGDLSDAAALAHLVIGCDAVIHVAGAIQANSRDEFLRTNRDGTRALLQAASNAGVRQFVHVSSLAAREPQLSDYAESKRLAEDVLHAYKGRMKITILRPSAIYGPGDKATLPLIKSLLMPVAVIPGAKANRFSLVHVNDFAAVCLTAARGENAGLFEIDDTAGGYTWSDLAAVTRRNFASPRKLFHLPRPAASAIASMGAVASKLNGKPAMLSHGKVNELYHKDWVTTGPGWPRANPVTIESGLPQTIQWYREQGWLSHRPALTANKSQSTVRT
jgi:nucleoside-diphosphate-sugar epimerase